MNEMRETTEYKETKHQGRRQANQTGCSTSNTWKLRIALSIHSKVYYQTE